MLDPKDVVTDLFQTADIRTDGKHPWDIRVTDDRFYARVVRDKSLGLGESYMEGWWTCGRIDQLIERILLSRLEGRLADNFRLKAALMAARLVNRQSRSRSYQVAERHYNLGNDLFFAFLDPYRQYSCGFFEEGDDVETAQRRKMDLICKKLNLSPGDRLLDIGSGWGGLAKYAAEHHGCEVTGINISDAQIRYSRRICQGLPVTFRHQDYRDLTETYDKIVSVGMFEHVGPRNYETFMNTVHRCLKPDGIFLLHSIGNNETGIHGDPWMEKYIFPNGKLPSIRQIAGSIEGRFVMEDWHNFGPDYDRTLMAWHRRFIDAWPELADRYGERFKRMWEYYLLSCAGAFRARSIQLWQVVMTHEGSRQPDCRY